METKTVWDEKEGCLIRVPVKREPRDPNEVKKVCVYVSIALVAVALIIGAFVMGCRAG